MRSELNKSTEQIEKLLKVIPVDMESVRVQFRMILNDYVAVADLDQKAMQWLVDDNATEQAQDEEFVKIRDIKVKVEIRVKVDDLLTARVQMAPAHDGGDASTSVQPELEGIGYRLPKVQFTSLEETCWTGCDFGHSLRKSIYIPSLLEVRSLGTY